MTGTLSLPAYQNNLAQFVSQLRGYLGLSQDEVAAHFYFDRTRISKYETDGQDDPRIGYVMGLACLIAEQENNQPDVQQLLLHQVNEVIRHHYRRRRFPNWDALAQETEAYLARQRNKFEKRTNRNWQDHLETRLDLPPAVELIGFENYLDSLEPVITSTGVPWIVCIEGLGGLGKTSLANAFVRQPFLANRFRDIAWVSAKRQSYLPGAGLQQLAAPVLTVETLIDTLLSQLDKSALSAPTPEQRRLALTEILKSAPFLIIIDNLETVEAYQTLLPTLQKLANPTKFLLTSRASLKSYADVFSFSLDELGPVDTMRLIRHEAHLKGLSLVTAAPDSQLDPIYDVVGGNPLAVKLVTGQVAILSLEHVLENLKKARGKQNEELYTFLYWEAWRLLTAASRQIFLMMPLIEQGTVEQLMAVSGFDRHELSQALQQLVELSLVQLKATDFQIYRYSIHSLTETFLLTEALKWAKPT